MLKHRIYVGLMAALLVAAQGAAQADTEAQSLEELRDTVVNLLDALVQKGIMTREQAQAMVNSAQAKAAATAKAQAEQEAAEQNAIRVPYVPQIVKDEISKQVETEIKPAVIAGVVDQAKAEKWGVPGALPEWLTRIRTFGDVTLRAQGDYFASHNQLDYWLDYNSINAAGGIANAGEAAFLNVSEDQDRLRVRARLGIEATISSWLTADIHLATGTLTDPVSQWQTLGQGGSRYPIGFDWIFLRAEEKTASQFPWLTVTGGRMPDPFLTPTNLIYYQDLAFEGVAATERVGFGDGSAGQSNVFATIGAFPLQQIEFANADSKWLLGGQLGVSLRGGTDQKLTLAGAYYDYLHVTGVMNTTDSAFYNFTAPEYIQFGNTYWPISNNPTNPNVNLFALAAHFKLENFALKYELPIGSRSLGLNWDWVRNVGYNVNDVFALTGISQAKRNVGSQEELTFGDPVVAAPGHWRALVGYRYLERDAVIDGFTDSDFHLGGTNARGYYIAGEVGVAPGTYLRVKYWSSDIIDGAPYGEDTVQIDINSRF